MGDVGAGQGESLSAAAHELASSPIGYAAELLAAMPSRRAALLLAFMDFGRAVDRISVMPPAHALAILREMDEVLAGRLLGRLLAHEVMYDLASVDPSWLGRVLRRMEFEHVEITLGGMAPEAAAWVLNNMPLQETAGILERWLGNSFPFSSIMDQFFGVSAPDSGARPLNGKVLDILSAMESPEVAEILRAASSYAFAADVMQAMPHARMVPVLALMSVDETAAMLTSVRTSPDHHSVPRFPAQRAAEVILALGPVHAGRMLSALHPAWVASMIRWLSPELAAQMLGNMSADQAAGILKGTERNWAKRTRKAMAEQASSRKV